MAHRFGQRRRLARLASMVIAMMWLLNRHRGWLAAGCGNTTADAATVVINVVDVDVVVSVVNV